MEKVKNLWHCPREFLVCNPQEMIEVILETMPIIMNIWDDRCRLISTSREALEIFGMSSQEEYIARFAEVSPPYQADGANSRDKALACVRQCLQQDEPMEFEWMHRTLDDQPLPARISL